MSRVSHPYKDVDIGHALEASTRLAPFLFLCFFLHPLFPQRENRSSVVSCSLERCAPHACWCCVSGPSNDAQGVHLRFGYSPGSAQYSSGARRRGRGGCGSGGGSGGDEVMR